MTRAPAVAAASRAATAGRFVSAFLLLGVLALAPFGSLLGHWFLRDDFLWLRDAELALAEPSRLWSTRPSNYFRPLGNVAFALERLVFGLDARGYYAVNLAVHAWNAAWLAALSWTLFRRRAAAAIAGFVFLFSSAWSGTVAWISNVVGLLAVATMLPTLVAHVAFLRGGSRWLYGATLAGTAACVSSKETGIVIAFALIALELRERGWRSFRARDTWLRYAPFALLAVLYVVLQRGQLRSGYAAHALDHPALWLERVLASIGRMLLGDGVLREHDLAAGAVGVIAIPALILAGGGRARWRDALASLALVVLAFVPFAGLTGSRRALISRYLYEPGTFLCLFAGLAFGLVLDRIHALAPRAARVATAAGALALAAWAAGQSRVVRAETTSRRFRGESLAMRTLVEGLRAQGVHGESARSDRWLLVGLPIEADLHLRCLGTVFLGLPPDAFEAHRLNVGGLQECDPLVADGGRALLETFAADRIFTLVEGGGLAAHEHETDPEGARLRQSLLASRTQPNAAFRLYVLRP